MLSLPKNSSSETIRERYEKLRKAIVSAEISSDSDLERIIEEYLSFDEQFCAELVKPTYEETIGSINPLQEEKMYKSFPMYDAFPLKKDNSLPAYSTPEEMYSALCELVERVTQRTNIEKTKETSRETTCINNARSIYLKCAINPQGDCATCGDYQSY